MSYYARCNEFSVDHTRINSPSTLTNLLRIFCAKRDEPWHQFTTFNVHLQVVPNSSIYCGKCKSKSRRSILNTKWTNARVIPLIHAHTYTHTEIFCTLDLCILLNHICICLRECVCVSAFNMFKIFLNSF